MRALLLWVATLVPLTLGVFLFSSGFFLEWRGVLTSTRPARAEDPATYTVLIVDNDGSETERELPAALVESLDLPVNSFGIAPPTLDPELPRTVKSRFQLQYNVTLADGSTRSIPTTTPESVGVAMLFFLLGLFGQNPSLLFQLFSGHIRVTDTSGRNRGHMHGQVFAQFSITARHIRSLRYANHADSSQSHPAQTSVRSAGH